VGEAVNGLEAIDMTRHLKPDLITMDVAMPVMDAFIKRHESLFPD